MSVSTRAIKKTSQGSDSLGETFHIGKDINCGQICVLKQSIPKMRNDQSKSSEVAGH